MQTSPKDSPISHLRHSNLISVEERLGVSCLTRCVFGITAFVIGCATALAVDTPDGEWHMPARDYASTRFGPLNQITAGNVRELRLAFSFSTGADRGHEAAPIVARRPVR